MKTGKQKSKSKSIKEYEWRYVSLTISGKNLDPQKITQTLGIEPDNWAKRDDHFGKNKKCKQGFWALEGGSSKLRFDTKLKKILNKILPVKHRLTKLINENKDIQRIYLDIAVMPPENTAIAEYNFEADLLNEFTSLGIDIAFSIHMPAEIKKILMKSKQRRMAATERKK